MLTNTLQRTPENKRVTSVTWDIDRVVYAPLSCLQPRRNAARRARPMISSLSRFPTPLGCWHVYLAELGQRSGPICLANQRAISSDWAQAAARDTVLTNGVCNPVTAHATRLAYTIQEQAPAPGSPTPVQPPQLSERPGKEKRELPRKMTLLLRLIVQ